MTRPPSRRFRPALNPLEVRDNPASLFTASGAVAGGVPLAEVDRPDGTALARFEAFEPTFLGGVRTAVGELDGNPNTVELVAAAGPSGGPRIRVFSIDTTSGQVTNLADVFVFEPSSRDGVRVAVGNIGGGPTDKIILGTDPGGGPRVRVMQLVGADVVPTTGPLSDFFAFEGSFRGGVRVAAGDVDGNPSNGDELVVGAGPGGGPRAIVFQSDGTVFQDSFVLPPDSTGGVNVSVVNGQVVADGLPDDVSQRNAALNAAALTAAQVLAAAQAQAAAAAAAGSTATTFATGNPAPGFGLNLPFAAPGVVVGNVLNTPGLFTTTATSGMVIGSAATAPGVFGVAGVGGVPFGSATTAPGVFGTTSGVTVGSTGTAPGVFTTTATPPLVTLSSSTTGPAVFGNGNTATPVAVTSAATAPGVFSTFTTTTGF